MSALGLELQAVHVSEAQLLRARAYTQGPDDASVTLAAAQVEATLALVAVVRDLVKVADGGRSR